jgi:hypothetical protein
MALPGPKGIFAIARDVTCRISIVHIVMLEEEEYGRTLPAMDLENTGIG